MRPEEIPQIGPYPVGRFVAEGGLAWVFEVLDPRLDARRALKLLKPGAIAEPDQAAVFERNLRLLIQIQHPNLVAIYDVGRDEATGCSYYTMEFVDGPSLAERVAQAGALPYEEAVSIFLDVLSGLAAVHDAGIVHRDVKPGNVLIARDGRAVLTDVGVPEWSHSSSGVTRVGGMHTSLARRRYMSPEQARGRPTGPRGDVFSVGLSFYEAITGSSVYENVDDDDDDESEVLYYRRSLQLEVDFPREPAIPKPIQDVVRQACQNREVDRYRDARAMQDALREALRTPSRTAYRPSAGGSGILNPLVWVAGGAQLAAEAFKAARERLRSRTRTSGDEAPIEFTAFFPSEMREGPWYSLLCYAHVQSARDSVEADRRSRAPESAALRKATARSKEGVARGATLRIVPEMPGCRFNPAQAQVQWLEAWHRVEFRVQASSDVPGFVSGGAATGRLSIYVGPILIGEVRLWTHFTVGDATDPDRPDTPSQYRPRGAVFVSYSHRDMQIAELLESAYGVLGYSYLRDVRALRSGEEWEPALLRKIEEADLFQLLWSRAASESPHVEREWRHALNLSRSDFIRPVYWEDPRPSPPQELERLHFSRLDLIPR